MNASSRLSRWWAGWRVAVRMARRDGRRHTVRSALIAVMVGLPVLFLTAGATLIATNSIDASESVPLAMGTAAARVQSLSSPSQMAQDASGSSSTGLSARALTMPGQRAGAALSDAQIGELLGGRAIPVTISTSTAQVGDRRISSTMLGVDGRDPVARPMTHLRSGRWPSSTGEVLVTPAGVSHGLPSSGRFSLTSPSPSGAPMTVTVQVVGIADALTEQGKPDLVGLSQLIDPAIQPPDYLVVRVAPVTWTDVRRLNTYGLTVVSRYVIAHPPSPDQLDPAVQGQGASGSTTNIVLVLLALGIFIETTLLAGPAFAVSAARQRHSLALAASNGAQARQLRRAVLGQALVLGVLSAIASVGLGIGTAQAAIVIWTAHDPSFAVGPFDVPWTQVLAILGCAIAASLVAAILPARGIGRLDIVGVLNGRVGAGRARRGLPVLGVVVMAGSAAACIGGAARSGGEVLVAGGAFGMVIGCLMVIPIVLAAVGRFGGRWVLPLRLATRDSARQRGRSTPAVAAIMAAVAGLTALSIGIASDNAQARRDYQMRVPMGTGQVQGDPATIEALFPQVRQIAPSLRVQEVGAVGRAQSTSGAPVQVVSALRPECTAKQSVISEGQTADRCSRLGTQAFGPRGSIAVMSSALSTDTLHLTAPQRALLDAGGMVVADASLVTKGRVRFVVGSQKIDDSVDGGPITLVGEQSIAATVVPLPSWQAAFPQSSAGAVLTPAAAAGLRWSWGATTLSLTSPTGEISPAVEQRIRDHLDTQSEVYVERGYQRPDAKVMLVLFGVAGLLVLIAALISTALSLAESEADMSTLAAVGATKRTRRGFAAGQALVVAVVGCLLGVAVGIVPGIAVTWPLTATSFDSVTNTNVSSAPTIAIPWWQLLAVAVGVPLLAALASAVAIRRAPTMVRRLG